MVKPGPQQRLLPLDELQLNHDSPTLACYRSSVSLSPSLGLRRVRYTLRSRRRRGKGCAARLSSRDAAATLGSKAAGEEGAGEEGLDSAAAAAAAAVVAASAAAEGGEPSAVAERSSRLGTMRRAGPVRHAATAAAVEPLGDRSAGRDSLSCFSDKNLIPG